MAALQLQPMPEAGNSEQARALLGQVLHSDLPGFVVRQAHAKESSAQALHARVLGPAGFILGHEVRHTITDIRFAGQIRHQARQAGDGIFDKDPLPDLSIVPNRLGPAVTAIDFASVTLGSANCLLFERSYLKGALSPAQMQLALYHAQQGFVTDYTFSQRLTGAQVETGDIVISRAAGCHPVLASFRTLQQPRSMKLQRAFGPLK